MIGAAGRARARRLLAAAAVAVAVAAGPGGGQSARAGGPLDVFAQQPVVYPNGGTAVNLNLDQGPLGTRSNAQAVALVQSAIALWNGVGTSTARLGLGPPLPTDYTSANYATILGQFSDGLNPVIFDSDGSITDAIFGANARNSIIGFAGSAYATQGPLAGTYVEGRALLNGSLAVPDATWRVVIAHELGHLIGLDHAQLDAVQGLASSNYVLMYPIAVRTLQSLHEDDAAAVSALYPAATVASVYGQLAGTLTTAGGVPVLGANVWARELTSGKVYSVVSDYLMQGSGLFRLLLPAGTYTLHAESIDAGFTGGSGVGPYAATATDVSFRAPHPIAPVTLGGGTPRLVPIVAGCLATATLRLDGTGTVAGNCATAGPAPPVLAGVVSRKLHAAAGSFDLPLSLAPTAPTVEPRQGPAATLVLSFDKPIASATAAVTAGAATLQGTTIAGSSVILTLAGVADAQYVTLALANVTAVDGTTGGTASVRVGFLAGDVNGSRNVSLSDLLAVNAALTQAVTAANYLADVNLSGTMTLADKLTVSSKLTRVLPAP